VKRAKDRAQSVNQGIEKSFPQVIHHLSTKLSTNNASADWLIQSAQVWWGAGVIHQKTFHLLLL
jgi:hypothetical protein